MDSPLVLLRNEPLTFVLLGIALIGALVLHEYAHAIVAHSQGDLMPKAQGRLTLNPARHLDPIGTLLIFLVGFGWAKPVEFRPAALRSQRFGAAMVALAGPTMNLLLAFLAASLYVVLAGIFNFAPLALAVTGGDPIGTFFLWFIAINVLLAIFNLVPLPPLDGSRLLTIFLPPHRQGIVFFLDRYGFFILLLLVFFGGFRWLFPVIALVRDLILEVSGAVG